MMAGPSTVRIALLLPDVLGTYSDRGNATVLAQRLQWRGMDVEVLEVPSGAAPPTSCDLFLLGGGEDAAQVYAARWLREHPKLCAALQTTQVVAVCAGLQLLGQWMQGGNGRRVPGAEVLDLTTSPGPRRSVGEVIAHSTAPGVATLTGFENHRGLTTLGPGLQPLGTVEHGTGNGDGGDGVLTPTIVATYLHGPVLARNPDLADLVLRRVTGLTCLPDLHLPDEAAARGDHFALVARARRSPRSFVGALRRARS